MRSSAAALLFVLFAALLAACGSSSSTTTTGNAGDTTSSTHSATTVTRTATRTATASASSATTSQSSAAAGAPPCRAAGLSLSFLGGQGATGHGLLGFALKNMGTASCSTVGYPGIQFLDRNGANLPTTPIHTTHDFFGSVPLGPLVVGAGDMVSFRIGVTHGNATNAGCTTAYALQVIPPNDTQTLRVSLPDGAYECTTATVSPLLSGTSAYP